MTFDELLTAVYEQTSRADLVEQTKNAVKAATLKAHRTDFYSKDIFETGIQFPSEEFSQSLDYIDLISNFRALKYLRRVDSATDEEGTFFEIITTDEILDTYGVNRTDIAYVAGRVLEIRASIGFQFALLGAYVLPIVTEQGFSSWIAEQHPYAIVYEAARIVFKPLGQAEEARGMRELVAEEYTILKMSALSDVGY